jgi:hypothetical protein
MGFSSHCGPRDDCWINIDIININVNSFSLLAQGSRFGNAKTALCGRFSSRVLRLLRARWLATSEAIPNGRIEWRWGESNSRPENDMQANLQRVGHSFLFDISRFENEQDAIDASTLSLDL